MAELLSLECPPISFLLDYASRRFPIGQKGTADYFSNHAKFCERCRKNASEATSWLMKYAESLNTEAEKTCSSVPLVMYSDELEAARPAVEPRIVLGEVCQLTSEDREAVRQWRDYLERKLACNSATPPSPDRDLGEEESVLKTMK